MATDCSVNEPKSACTSLEEFLFFPRNTIFLALQYSTWNGIKMNFTFWAVQAGTTEYFEEILIIQRTYFQDNYDY